MNDLLSQGKAENHVVEVRNKSRSPQAGNFTQHGPNTPVWKRWSGWMLWKWEEDKHITTSVIGLGDAGGECLRSLDHGGWWHHGSIVFVKMFSSPLACSPMQRTPGNICSRGVSSWTKFQGSECFWPVKVQLVCRLMFKRNNSPLSNALFLLSLYSDCLVLL